MPTTGLRSTAAWRLGVPAALMVAFALVGLLEAPWRTHQTPPVAPPSAVRADEAPVAGPDITARAAAESRAEDAGPCWTPVEPAPARAEEAPAPVDRLPEELQPVAPDVVVAMEPAYPEAGWLPPATHAHGDEGAPDALVIPAVLEGASTTGDDVLGPEAGARFWFGPSGLERVRVLGEVPR